MADNTGMMIAQVVVSLLLVATVLLQQRGTGLGGAFGGEGNVYRSRRGTERFLFGSTIVLGVAFVALAGISVFLAR
ncbi:MAG: preprotein translocase subunit SecG [Patescibacteria group bacterium]|jgi:protein translocase SecG subunit